MSTDSGVAGRVDRLLELRNTTLKDFASQIGLPYRTVQNYLTGDVKIPVVFLEKCCDYFGVEADYLLFGGVDLSRTAMLSAIESALKNILSSLDLKNGEIIIGEDRAKHVISSDVLKSFKGTLALSVSSAIRDGYLRLRTDEVRAGSLATVSPGDEAITQMRVRDLERYGR